MLYFENDYCEGAHEEILKKLVETNLEKTSGYGTDPYCASAREKIRGACSCPEADVFFVSGGTQANVIVIAAMLRRYEGVVAAATGHIHGHEAGAVEYTGHKVLALPQTDGKLSAADLREYLETYYADANHEHMTFPGMVYISYPTEYGTLYTKAELEALHQICAQYQIPLFMDGARLGYGLAAARRRMCSLFRAGHRPTSSLLRRCCAGTKGSWPLLPAISTAMRQAPWNIQGIKCWRCRRRMENFRPQI